jgi:hypothetical protein
VLWSLHLPAALCGENCAGDNALESSSAFAYVGEVGGWGAGAYSGGPLKSRGAKR